MSKLPWDYYTDLSLDRLQLVAKILIDTRRETLLLHDPSAGDTPWSLGCRIYARSAEMIARAAASMFDWLKVIDSSLEFVFSIGNVPVRFFRGDADNPGGRHLRISEAEASQLFFAFGDQRIDLVWRIAVETNGAGETARVVLIGATPSGACECSFTIPPLNDSVSFIEPLRPQTNQGIELPAPVVLPRRERRTKGEDEGKKV